MKVLLDTNVIMSAVFFGGFPLKILNGWRNGAIELVVSEDILSEYVEIASRLHKSYPQIDFIPWIEFIRQNATNIDVRGPYKSVCDDPDDDMFIACALASEAKLICSGDRHLLAVDGYQGIEILPPRQFIQKHL